MIIRNRKAMLALLPAALSLLAPAVSAQTGYPAHKPNIIQRHPTATGFAAGIATHSALKRSAAYKKAHGQRLNFAERHPTMSGFGVGAVTRHEIKAHTAH